LPRQERDAAQSVHRAYGQAERGGRGLEVAAVTGRAERGFMFRVDDEVCATPAGEIAAPRGEVAGHDRLHATGLEHRDDGEPDRSATDHDGDIALLDLAAPDGVQPDSHRLGERRELGGQARGHGHGERLLDHHLLRVSTRCVHGEPDRVHVLATPDQR
jgi:hypothetical protein